MGQTDFKPQHLLARVWDSQRLYNRRLRLAKGIDNEEGGTEERLFWNKQYLLGLVSEIDEVLRELDWKEHRNQLVLANERNLAFELADLTKYVLSLWQVNGFSLPEMLQYTMDKGQVLEEQWQMDFTPIPEGWPILIVDVDGTLGDYRKAFADYVAETYDDDIRWAGGNEDSTGTLLMDLDMGLSYPQYHPLKEEFEASGGYEWLPPYHDAFNLVADLKQELGDLVVIVYTARPAGRYKHIWMDTLKWLWAHNLHPHQLHIGGTERVLMADQFRQSGHWVAMLDDDPDVIRRASSSLLPIIGRRHGYNQHLDDYPYVTLTNDYSSALSYLVTLLQTGRTE